METVFAYIDSRDAEPGGTASNFSVQLPEPLQFYSDTTRLRVDNVRLVNSFRTVGPTNCYIYVQEGDSVRCCTLDLGWHNALDLGPVIASALGGAYNVLYDGRNNSLIISRPTDFSILTDAQCRTVGSWPGPPGTSQASPRSFNNILQNPGGIVTSNSYTVPFLSITPYDYVFLRSYRLASSRSISQRGEHDILCRIDVNEAFGNVLTGGTPLQEALVVGSGTYQNLDFFVTDRYGNPVSLDQGSLTFQLTFFS